MNSRTIVFGILWTLATFASAGDTYHEAVLRDLDFAPGQEHLDAALERFPWGLVGLRFPDSVEVYLADGEEQDPDNRFRRVRQGNLRVVARITDTEPVSGFVDLQVHGDVKLQPFALSIDPGKVKPITRERFEKLRALHYSRVAQELLPGRPWFRQRSLDAGPRRAATRRGRQRESELTGTFALFSGRTAVTENLALDRELILGRDGGGAEDVPVAEIEGIRVKPIDWTRRLPEGEIPVDPLSMVVPHDQHAVFFPTMGHFLDLLELLDQQGAPVMGAFDASNPFHGMSERYLRQMGIPDRERFRELPVRGVALTGGDPFLPTGSDLAILFESDDPEALLRSLNRLVEKGDHRRAGQVVRLGGHVAISNSAAQLERLRAVVVDGSPSLGGADEFKFFRNRYPVGAAGESAFLFLSDATIRRWGGPRMRIAASRRARAIAALEELTAAQIAGAELGQHYAPLLGELSVADGSKTVRSERFGSLDFITPVAELEIEQVTALEKSAYVRWRNGYENGWAQVFDPIAIRLDTGDKYHALDLTVLPLTVDSEYRQWLDLAGGAKLSPAARRAHEQSLLFGSFAIDAKSEPMGELDTELIGLLPSLKIKPLSWVGQSVSLFLDDGFFWKALDHAGDDIGNLQQSLHHLPVGLRVESNSSVKLALFMAAIKGLAESSAPDLLSWEKRKHAGRSYVVVSGDSDEMGMDLAIYYAATPTALLASLDEEVLKRAIERENGLGEIDAAGVAEAAHGFFQSSPQMLAKISSALGGKGVDDRRREESWAALPVLNEWRRLDGAADPTDFHRRWFGENLVCPGGKGYRWNAEAMTMESVAYGFPAGPRDDGLALGVLDDFNQVSAGGGFEDDGLRLWVRVEKIEDGGAARKGDGPGPGEVEEEVILATAEALTPSKPGGVFKFRWTSSEPESVQSVEVLEPDHPGEFVTRQVWEVEGEEPEESTLRQRIDRGLRTIAEKGEGWDSVYREPFLELPEKLVKGQAIEQDYIYETDEDGARSLTIGEARIVAVGLERVEVAAGVFDDCVRVETLQRDASGGYISVLRETCWFKDGVGPVKIEQVLDGVRSEGELVEFSIPAE